MEFMTAALSGKSVDSIAGVATINNRNPLSRPNIHNLDQLPFIDIIILAEMIRHNGNSTKGIQATLPTSRGCAFCSISSGTKSNTGQAFRELSVNKIAHEMLMIYEHYNITDFYFCSAQFLPNDRSAAEEKANLFYRAVSKLPFQPSIFLYIRCDNVTKPIAEHLSLSGVSTVFIGAESFDDLTLEKLEKGLSSTEIKKALELLQEVEYSCDYRAKRRMKLGFIMFTP